MSKEVHKDSTDALRYLDANSVECSSGTLEGLSLFSKDDQALGVIDGVLIDPATRKLRYFVVEKDLLFHRRRYLVSAEMPAVVLPEEHALRVEIPSDRIQPQRFDSRAVPRFSDDDLLASMFSGYTS